MTVTTGGPGQDAAVSGAVWVHPPARAYLKLGAGAAAASAYKAVCPAPPSAAISLETEAAFPDARVRAGRDAFLSARGRGAAQMAEIVGHLHRRDHRTEACLAVPGRAAP